jgi:TatD DNase family protein
VENQTIDVIDIGVNLTHDSFDPDRDAVIERARQAGVSRMIVTGTTVAASLDAAELAAARPGQLYATAGIHPHHAAELGANSSSQLSAIAARPGVVAIGECGLDYFRNYSPRDAQLKAFEAQLQLAEQLQKPVFLHQRDAHDDFLALLKDYLPRIPGGVAHCFTAGLDELREYLDLGLYIGITGWICDERRGHSLREAVLELPMERVLLETDAPYLVPRDLPEKPGGRRNEPQYLPHILASVARIMRQEPAALAAATRRNTENLFALPNGR